MSSTRAGRTREQQASALEYDLAGLDTQWSCQKLLESSGPKLLAFSDQLDAFYVQELQDSLLTLLAESNQCIPRWVQDLDND